MNSSSTVVSLQLDSVHPNTSNWYQIEDLDFRRELTGEQDEGESERVLGDEVEAVGHLGREVGQQDLNRNVELEKENKS